MIDFIYAFLFECVRLSMRFAFPSPGARIQTRTGELLKRDSAVLVLAKVAGRRAKDKQCRMGCFRFVTRTAERDKQIRSAQTWFPIATLATNRLLKFNVQFSFSFAQLLASWPPCAVFANEALKPPKSPQFHNLSHVPKAFSPRRLPFSRPHFL